MTEINTLIKALTVIVAVKINLAFDESLTLKKAAGKNRNKVIQQQEEESQFLDIFGSGYSCRDICVSR